MTELDESVIPGGQRPSYLDFDNQDSRRLSDFDERVVKKLSEEFTCIDTKRPSKFTPDTEKIKTYLRIRPYVNKNKTVSDPEMIEIKDPKTITVRHVATSSKRQNIPDKTTFTFSKVLGPKCNQIIVFEECVQSVLERFFCGESCLIFSYGATNSGKTYTMQGHGTQYGIVPRTLENLFNRLEETLYKRGNIKPNLFCHHESLSEQNTQLIKDLKLKILRDAKIKTSEITSFRDSVVRSSSSVCSYSNEEVEDKIHTINSVPYGYYGEDYLPNNATLHCIWVSFAEIYNERVYDLFETVQRGKKRREMKLLADKEGRVYIKDLTEICANSAEEAYQLFLAGKSNLQFAATQMNSNSSRSHSFFNIRMVSVGTADGIVYPKKVFRMSFCDLAGAERVSQTGNIGVRLKESGNINQSLLVLLRCIRAMRDRQTGKHSSTEVMPFRESKLTRLFQSYLTTATRICMIVNINQDEKMYDSTMQVLHNSAVASDVITFRKVEPPMNDSLFCRKLRESLKFSRQTIDDTSDKNEGEEEDDADEYQCETVVPKQLASAKLVSSNKKSYSELEEEIRVLNGKLAVVEEELREDMQTQFKKIYQEQEDYWTKRMKSDSRATEGINARRISMAAKVLASLSEEEQTEGDNALGMSVDTKVLDSVTEKDQNSDGYDDIDSGKENETTGDEGSYLSVLGSSKKLFNTPEQRNFPVSIRDTVKEIHDLKKENEELVETIKALQESVDDKKSKITKYQLELTVRKTFYEGKLDTLGNIIQLKNKEISKIKDSDPSKRADNSFLEIEILSAEVEKKSKEVELLQIELEDGRNTCIEYDEKLTLANSEIKKLTAEVNLMHKKNRELKEEVDIIHFSFEDAKKKLAALEASKAAASTRVEDNQYPNNGGKSRPRRKTAKYVTPTKSKIEVKSTSKRKTNTKRQLKTFSEIKLEDIVDDDSFEVSMLTDEEDDASSLTPSPVKRLKQPEELTTPIIEVRKPTSNVWKIKKK